MGVKKKLYSGEKPTDRHGENPLEGGKSGGPEPSESEKKKGPVVPKPMGQKKEPVRGPRPGDKKYYSTQEVADRLGLTQTTLTLWIRNKMVDDAKVKRDASGRRLWTEENIEEVRKLKKEEGWS